MIDHDLIEALVADSRRERAYEKDRFNLLGYEPKAKARLAAIDALDPLCRWDQHSYALDDDALAARWLWYRLMDEQGQAEVDAGM